MLCILPIKFCLFKDEVELYARKTNECVERVEKIRLELNRLEMSRANLSHEHRLLTDRARGTNETIGRRLMGKEPKVRASEDLNWEVGPTFEEQKNLRIKLNCIKCVLFNDNVFCLKFRIFRNFIMNFRVIINMNKLFCFIPFRYLNIKQTGIEVFF